MGCEYQCCILHYHPLAGVEEQKQIFQASVTEIACSLDWAEQSKEQEAWLWAEQEAWLWHCDIHIHSGFTAVLFRPAKRKKGTVLFFVVLKAE